MPGGFAGVDVFFVISGFLMTGIIFRGIEQDRFSILDFYVARANRIIPALAALCVVTLVFGWFFVTPLDYKALGKHVESSMGFYSNFIYWSESGYFDAASHEKWLLHTWSLSAEWQFYILYPLVLVAMRMVMSVSLMKAMILLGTIAGFLFCVLLTYKLPTFSYYLLPTRAWEMMLGGVAYLYPLSLANNRKKLLEWTGLALVITSYIVISKENPWPGYLAIFPAIGAFLIIQAQRNDSLVTGNIVFQKVGKWSYSIYLWHWPIVVVIYYYALNSLFIFPGIILSIFLGFLSNQYIENLKFKKSFDKPLHYLKCKPLHMAIVVGLMGSATYLTDGFESHYSSDVVKASKEAINKNPYNCLVERKFPCIIGNEENIQAIMVGDSHADALTTSLAAAFDLSTEGIVALTKDACPFILNIKSVADGDRCLKENERRQKYLNEHHTTTPVFWVARTAVYVYGQSNPDRIKDVRDTQPLVFFSEQQTEATPALFSELEENLDQTIKQISANRDVYLVLPTPEMRRHIPNKMSRGLLTGQDLGDFSIHEDLYRERNQTIIELINNVGKNNGLTVLDPAPYLCKNSRCMAQYQGRPIYYDGDHLSEYGNKLLTPMFKSALPGASK